MVKSKIDIFKNDIRYKDKIVYVKTIPAKKASYKKIDNLNEVIINYLKKKDIKLYKHQADSYEAINNNENIIITTPTASGKTLAFNLPVMNTMINDNNATSLYIYPAKALANDQLSVLKNLENDLNIKINPRRYDGDTPKSKRKNIRDTSRIVLTNPYQLHLILSWHHQWKKFYSNLKYIIIDEAHYYKGVFGSNVAYLIRRLKRIANNYGSSPQFILSSATLANPLELANKLTGEKFKLIDNDASPSGEKDFILYNPFKNYRRTKVNGSKAPSVHIETENIFNYLMMKDIQTLCFTVSRKITELIARWSQNDMKKIKPKLAHRITAYRAGYRVNEREEIENGLKSRKYLGVTCTNALELGINIGTLDAVIISGYPGTMISTWQQSGRAGRSNQKSLAILIAFENQLDQYFMNNPKFFFDKSHENAIIDLNNEILKNAHLQCAAKELPLTSQDSEKYFNISEDTLKSLARKKILIQNYNKEYVYLKGDNPAFNHPIDQLSEERFKVMNNGNLLEIMDRSQVYREAHEGAVLINKGETYTVNNVNLSQKYVNVVKQEVDYHTMVLNNTEINIEKKISKTKYGDLIIYFGELTVKEDYYKYKKLHFSKSLGTFNLDLPPLKFKTKGLWFSIPEKLKNEIEEKYTENEVYEGGLHGVEHALISLFPLHVMCDRFDIGGLSTNYHKDTQQATIFIYDAYEGGIGITEKAIDIFPDLLKSTKDLLDNCECVSGCPSCIYSPKCGNDNKPLNKDSTKDILNYMCSQIFKNESSKDLVKNSIETKKNNNKKSENFKSKNDLKLNKNPLSTIKDSNEILYEEAYDLFTKGDYFNAKDILNEIIVNDNKNVHAYALLARILREQGDIRGAKLFAKKARSLNNNDDEQINKLLSVIS